MPKLEKDNDIATSNNFEELDQIEENEEELITKRKKKYSKNLNKTILKFILINLTLAPIIYIIYLLYNNKIVSKNIIYEMSNTPKQKLQELNLKLKHTINYINDESANNEERKKFPTEYVAQFPCGDLISVDWISVVIYDNDYNIKQRIYVFDVVDKLHYFRMQKKIYKVAIKDDNTFAISSNEGLLKIYSKKDDKFELKQEINDILVYDIIFDSKGKLIACARGNKIKILEQNEQGKYVSKKSLEQADASYATVFEDKNILISKSIPGFQIYDINQNYKLINEFKERSIHDLERLDEDRFILYHNNSLKIFSLNEQKIIKTIRIGFEAYSIKYYKEKGVIILGGIEKNNKGPDSSKFVIINGDNFEVIKTIENVHDSCVRGIVILKNGLISTYGNDQNEGYPIKIWSLE